MATIDDIEIPSLLLAEQGAAPATPASGFGRLYAKSTGLFFVGDDGVEVGPFGTGGGSTTELLAVKRYGPAQTILSSGSTALVDADATNLAVTFTAPASGRVLVRLNGHGDTAGGAAETSWGLREGTTDIAAAKVIRNAANEGFVSLALYLTGVAAGSHTYKWSHGVAAGGQTSRIIVGPGAGISDFPAAVMEVWSAP